MTFFNRQREWYFYMEEIFSLNSNLLINNDVSLNGNLNVNNISSNVITSNDLSANTITATRFFGDGSQLDGITDTTYTAGLNMLLNGTEFNIPQSINTNDNVQFNQVTASSFIGNGSNLSGINEIGGGGDGGDGFVFIDGAGNITLQNTRYSNNANSTNRGLIHLNAHYQVRTNGNFLASSDDRLKHNEIDISNALSTIRQLKAQKYQKTNEMKDADYIGDLSNVDWIYEAGFIAQDILKISNLDYLVDGGDYIDDSGNEIIEKYYLNYNDIFVYNVAATQELDVIVQQQKNEINYLKDKNLELENKVDLLKNKLNELLSESGKETINF